MTAPPPSPRLAADLLFDRLFGQLKGARHANHEVNQATLHLFWRIHNSYNSIRFLQATDPAAYTLVDQHTIIRCMYEALVNLEHIATATNDETILRATQFILHINVLLEKDLLKNIPNLQTNIKQRIMRFFAHNHDDELGTIKRKAQQWRDNNKTIHSKTKPDLIWHGYQRLGDVALHHDEQFFMHTVFHHAVHTNFVPLRESTYQPGEITNLSIMIFARAFQALYAIHNLEVPRDDAQQFALLCRPLDQQFNEDFSE
jgi:hypothetical protein